MSAPTESRTNDNVIDLAVHRAVRTIQKRRAVARRPVAWTAMPQAYAWAPWLVVAPVISAPVARVRQRSSG